MSEEKEYPTYNINVGTDTSIDSLIRVTTHKYHPYGLSGFREDIIKNVDEWQSKGLAWYGHDQLTHAWRTPWDIHLRYPNLMSPIVQVVYQIANILGELKSDWFLKNSWISEYTQSSAANKHHHSTDIMGWSFCYYVKVPDEGPAFTLFDDVQGKSHQLNVTDGDLLFFRSPVPHQVLPSVGRRIIISGNLESTCSHDAILHEKFFNENFHKENSIMLSLLDNHHDVDFDDWNTSVIKQRLKVDSE